MGKKRKRRRSSQYGWFVENWKYLSLSLVVALTAGLVVVALDRPEPTPAADMAEAATPLTAEAQVPLPLPVVAFVGDSYTKGINRTTDPTDRWSTVLAAEFGWREVNLGVGGSGFLQGEVYAGRAQAIIDSRASIVIVSGGRNDITFSREEQQAATAAFFTRIRAGLPDAQIIAVAPWWDDDPAPDGLTGISESIKAAVEAAGGTFVDAGQPLFGHPEFLVEDGVHPNPAGYVAIVSALREPLKAAVQP